MQELLIHYFIGGMITAMFYAISYPWVFSEDTAKETFDTLLFGFIVPWLMFPAMICDVGIYFKNKRDKHQ